MSARTLEQVGGTLTAIAICTVLLWIALPEIAAGLEAWAEVWRVGR
jgi:hypothetical protein